MTVAENYGLNILASRLFRMPLGLAPPSSGTVPLMITFLDLDQQRKPMLSDGIGVFKGVGAHGKSLGDLSRGHQYVDDVVHDHGDFNLVCFSK